MQSYESYYLQLPELHEQNSDEQYQPQPHDIPGPFPLYIPFPIPVNLPLPTSCNVTASYSLSPAPVSMGQMIWDEMYGGETLTEENNAAHHFTAYDGLNYHDYDYDPASTTQDYTQPDLGSNSPSSTYSGDSIDSEDSTVDTTTTPHGSNVDMPTIPENNINFYPYYYQFHGETNIQYPGLFSQMCQNDLYDGEWNSLKQPQPQPQFPYTQMVCESGCNCPMCTAQEGDVYPHDPSQVNASTNDYSQYSTPENIAYFEFGGSEFSDQPTVPSSPLLNESNLPANDVNAHVNHYYCSQNEVSLSTTTDTSGGGIC